MEEADAAKTVSDTEYLGNPRSEYACKDIGQRCEKLASARRFKKTPAPPPPSQPLLLQSNSSYVWRNQTSSLRFKVIDSPVFPPGNLKYFISHLYF